MVGTTQVQSNFSEIVKKAYEIGISDRAITVQKLIEDIKSDLIKTGQYTIKTG
ncbi:hypothetical protein [Neobacillus sp. PS3-40]|jgi:hypothetical protein|uniref:hypothetical protein n=1 Tax=Neobacillus sp. PS3-40 TaxID=3070679 RepID=UPI0027E0BD8A|nr:hypothetical protein [Neobacillus sp. PS3-40]WML46203.1 hypothetical protein RCG20_10040 [Neobacillus sp. PS3-40]